MKDSITGTRAQFLKRTFPDGAPLLWCPPLTHYHIQGAIDASRMEAHWGHLAAYVRGFLIPGSTGDGWELTAAERRQVLETGLELAKQLKVQILIGALHPKIEEALGLI